MSAQANDDSDGGRVTRDEKAIPYWRAAEATLDQLDWCIDYLHSIRRKEIARALSRNRDHLRRQIRKPGSRA